MEGGNDPHSPTHYHPLVITDEPLGGYEQMTEEQRKDIRVLAGVEFTRRGQPRPTAGQFLFTFLKFTFKLIFNFKTFKKNSK